MIRPLLALALLALPLQASRASSGEDLERWLRALDAVREPEWTAALDALVALGEPAAERALADFETLPFPARRARAQLLGRIPSPAQCARVLALAADPDPEVRRLLAAFLGNPALAGAAARERVDALARLALEDPNGAVRARSREALGECALAEAVPALDGLLERLPEGEAEKAAAALVQLPAGRERLIARVTEALPLAPGAAAVPDGVLAALLRGYGRALAEVPGGGEERRERLPFLAGRTHLAREVRAAAAVALGVFVARAAELSEAERAERVLARLGEEGWPLQECVRRRLDLAWLQRGDAAGALDLARALMRSAQGLPPAEAEAWELRGRLFEGAALHATGDRAGADALFVALAARLAADGARADLFPSPLPGSSAGREVRVERPEWTQGGGSTHIDRLHLCALAHLWRALIALADDAGDARVDAELRAVHLLFLESLAVARRTKAPDPGTLDSLLERDLSPYTLVLFNERLAPEQRGQSLDQALALGAALGRVAPLEMLGFAPPGAGGSDLFVDRERRARLEDVRVAERQALKRELEDLESSAAPEADPDVRYQLGRIYRQRDRELVKAENDERAALKELSVNGRDPRTLPGTELMTIYKQLLEYLTPSMHAHTLAGELRAEGRAAEARGLCERALETLRTAPLGYAMWAEFSSARFELLLGSTLMDEARPADAERAYQDGERRLASIEQRLRESRTDSESGVGSQAESAQIRMVAEMRGEALLSLAVNANVRMGDPARALAYFERAYELNQSPFMRVLRACYRARSGKAAEARTVLASVVPTPSLYYNIACTHALLGETGPALDYLERDLAVNHPTAGARAQKLDWARKDPDLAKLRGEPRFERLLGGAR